MMDTRTRTGDMPRGTVRPDIAAPDTGELVADSRQPDLRHVWLTDYRFRDESEYTHKVFDYRLRWTLHATHRTMSARPIGVKRDTEGWANATVEVWSRRDCEWHDVWSISRDAASPYGKDATDKAISWNLLLADLADKATVVLL